MRKRERWNIDTIDLTEGKPQKTDEKNDSPVKSFVKKHWKKALLILGIAYLIVLIFGFASTRYYTDEDGNRRAYRLSFSDMELQDDYRVLRDQLTDIRDLLSDIAVVDIHLANGTYTDFEASTLYIELLDEKLDVMIPKISAMNLQKEQEPIREAMESILSYDLALYLQNISKALKSGDTATAQTALTYRASALKTYEVIENEMKAIAEKLKLETGSYYEWELYKAAEKKDSGAVLKTGKEETSEQ